MASVTYRVKNIKQPYGGYLPIKKFHKEQFDDGIVLNENENVGASIIGTAVDYLIRFLLGDSVDKAFHISCLGASIIGMSDKAEALKKKIKGIDNDSITSACKLAGFDVCYRSSMAGYRAIEDINPDECTIDNIRVMVTRSLSFFEQYGPVICSEPTFDGGYTDTVNAGDGDFLTQDALWDFKVSKNAPTAKNSLQLLMYYVMGLHSKHDHFAHITRIGMFNPRLNIAYICPVSIITTELISVIEKDVICYGTVLKRNDESSVYVETLKRNDEFLTVADICDMVGVSKNIVYADIQKKRLKAFKKGNKYYITYEEYRKYIEQIKLQRKIQLAATCITTIIMIALLLFVIIIIAGR